MPPPALRVDKTRITRFELVRREVLAMLLAGSGLLLLAHLRTRSAGRPDQFV